MEAAIQTTSVNARKVLMGQFVVNVHLDTLIFPIVNPVIVFILEELFQKAVIQLLVSVIVKVMLLDYNVPHVKLDSIYPSTLKIMTILMKAVL